MDCEERARLEKQLSESKTRYEEARQALHGKIGVSTREEFLQLSKAIQEASDALQRSNDLLEQHAREHDCESAAEGAAEV